MKRYKPPKCISTDPDGTVCGIEMKVGGERHPMHQKGHYIFYCPRCEAVRVLGDSQIGRYVERA